MSNAGKVEAKDVRVGNIVSHKNRGANGYTFINARDILTIADFPESDWVKGFSYIPITEEWLVRLGELVGNKTYRVKLPVADLWIEIYWYEYSATGNSFAGWRLRKVERKVNMSLDPPREYFEERTDIFMIGYLEYVHDLQNWYYYNTNKTELEIK